jgi:hypothetical protein
MLIYFLLQLEIKNQLSIFSEICYTDQTKYIMFYLLTWIVIFMNLFFVKKKSFQSQKTLIISVEL